MQGCFERGDFLEVAERNRLTLLASAAANSSHQRRLLIVGGTGYEILRWFGAREAGGGGSVA